METRDRINRNPQQVHSTSSDLQGSPQLSLLTLSHSSSGRRPDAATVQQKIGASSIRDLNSQFCQSLSGGGRLSFPCRLAAPATRTGLRLPSRDPWCDISPHHPGPSKRTAEPLVVLKYLLLIPFLQVISHSVRPLQGHPTPENLVHGLLHELNLDPRQSRRELHFFHFLLGLGIQVHGQLSRLLVICPSVVVLKGGDISKPFTESDNQKIPRY